MRSEFESLSGYLDPEYQIEEYLLAGHGNVPCMIDMIIDIGEAAFAPTKRAFVCENCSGSPLLFGHLKRKRFFQFHCFHSSSGS